MQLLHYSCQDEHYDSCRQPCPSLPLSLRLDGTIKKGLTLLAHSPARGLYELYMTWGLRRASRPQPERGAIVTVVESLIKSNVFFIRTWVLGLPYE